MSNMIELLYVHKDMKSKRFFTLESVSMHHYRVVKNGAIVGMAVSNVALLPCRRICQFDVSSIWHERIYTLPTNMVGEVASVIRMQHRDRYKYWVVFVSSHYCAQLANHRCLYFQTMDGLDSMDNDPTRWSVIY